MRMTGRLLRVWTEPRGTTLTADAAAGATVLSVDDASAFDMDDRVLIADQQTTLLDVDDDTSTVTLANPLDEAAEADDSIDAWSTLYEQVDVTTYADVEVEGEGHNLDPVTAVVGEGLNLAPGDRGGPGETVVLELDGDEWVLIRVPGRPSKARDVKFEADDAHTLTPDDVTAGVATFTLSHRPLDESVEGYWAGLRQPPSEFTVDYHAPAVTWPLSGFEAAGDVLGVHYAYRAGIVVPEAWELVVKGSGHAKRSNFGPSLTVPISPPAAGDLILLATARVVPQDVPAGWAFIKEAVSSDGTPLRLYQRVADGTETSVSLNGQNAHKAGITVTLDQQTVAGSAARVDEPGSGITFTCPSVAAGAPISFAIYDGPNPTGSENITAADTTILESGGASGQYGFACATGRATFTGTDFPDTFWLGVTVGVA